MSQGSLQECKIRWYAKIKLIYPFGKTKNRINDYRNSEKNFFQFQIHSWWKLGKPETEDNFLKLTEHLQKLCEHSGVAGWASIQISSTLCIQRIKFKKISFTIATKIYITYKISQKTYMTGIQKPIKYWESFLKIKNGWL